MSQRQPRHNYPKSEPFDFSDHITLGGAVPISVGQYPHEDKVVQSSHVVRHTPRYTDSALALLQSMKHFEPTIYESPAGTKWCSCCGQWVNKRGFSPKADARDGLHPHCKQCRAEHAKKMYYLTKERIAA